MKSPNYGGNNIPTRHLSPASETSSAGNELQLVELFLNIGPWKSPPTTLPIAKVIAGSSQTGPKSLFLKTTPIYLLNMKKSSWCQARSFTHTD